MTRKIMFATIFCAGFLMLLTVTGWTQNVPRTEKYQGSANFKRLEGRWVRPDGGYVLEIGNIAKDGSMTAAYFNPKPIRVFQAKANRKDGKIHLSVELRDVNYPGSMYALEYDPRSDRLKGTYFQAVERLSFNIEFVRQNNAINKER